MSSTPTISIIVPAYNVAGFIDDCLGHILPQLRAQHELLVVDDGSTDTTAQQVRALAARWPQCALRLLQQPNGGISAARNAGVAAASGDYLLFVDSDDRLQADALAALDGVLAAHQPDVIATDFCMWHPDSPGKDRRVAMSYVPNRLTEGQDAILAPFFADRHMYVWCKIVRRAIYLELGQPLFPPRRLFEDVAVVPRLLARCRTLYYLPTVLLAYRQHPVSITRVISAAWCRDFVAALAAVKPHFERIGVSEAVRAQFDAAACHFYIGVVKNSYQLPAASGDLVRIGLDVGF